MCDLFVRTVCVDLPLLASSLLGRSQLGGPGCSGAGGEVAGLVFVGSSRGSEQVTGEEAWLLP